MSIAGISSKYAIDSFHQYIYMMYSDILCYFVDLESSIEYLRSVATKHQKRKTERNMIISIAA